jgi:hypothetical protein
VSSLQNMYIKHPMSIEQYLMEGSYNKVFLARDNVPADSYRFFINMLLETLRFANGALLIVFVAFSFFYQAMHVIQREY